MSISRGNHVNITRFYQGSPGYPSALREYLGDLAPAAITALGNLEILTGRIQSSPLLALFCSVRCPGNLILQTYDFAQRLRQTSITVIGGFHSPVERECLTILLRSPNPIIVCPARGIENMRLPSAYKKPLAEGRLLLLSPFAEKQHRATVQMALYRNQFVAALADQIFVAYAGSSSKTEQFCRDILTWRKPLYTLESDADINLIALGAKAVSPDNPLEWTRSALVVGQGRIQG